ncbi:unnamed protein product [Durusdinium trenchii]|uniref:Prolyl 4-hydroxylase subunit alpha-1 n=2 Tax=Durusdinium trenchii TaxID=1381693 RepID=A0ABP0P4Z5_9DINO
MCICIEQSAFAVLDPVRDAPLLPRLRVEFVPCSRASCCNEALARWRLVHATCFTLARGVVPAQVVCLRCEKCETVYAGCWQWSSVPAKSRFPEGFHNPRYVGLPQGNLRWFFAPGPWLHMTPQIVFEIALLDFLLALAARAGVTLSAFHAVYMGLWPWSSDGTAHSRREHFVKKTIVILIVWAAVQMFLEAGLNVSHVIWYLRPHHTANDFANILPLVREAFQTLAQAHACYLFRRVPAVVVDGKWCVQTLLCNARNGNPVYEPALQLGYLQGCRCRPLRGSKYCEYHNAAGPRPNGPVEVEIIDHRQVTDGQGVHLQYKIGDVWHAATTVATGAVRKYELQLLRRQGSRQDDSSCNKDERKDTDEPSCGRRTAGILALRFVIYDNACAVVRMIQKRTRNGANWAQLAGLKWVIDRLHFTYHKACQDQSSGWYAPGTNPAEHPELRGIDTEAAEQVFSIANRWQVRGAGCPLLVEAKRQRRRLLLVLLI